MLPKRQNRAGRQSGASASGTTICEPPARGQQLLELTTPRGPVTGWDVHELGNPPLGLRDERADVAATDVRGHDHAAFAVLPADQVRSRRERPRNGRQRDEPGAARARDRGRRRRLGSGIGKRLNARPDRSAALSGSRTRMSKRRSPSNTCPAARPPIATSTTSWTSATFRPSRAIVARSIWMVRTGRPVVCSSLTSDAPERRSAAAMPRSDLLQHRHVVAEEP